MSKMSGYVKICRIKDVDKDKNNKLMSVQVDDGKLLERHETICTKTEDLKNIELNALPVYDDRYITIKIKTYRDKVYIYFRGLNMPEDDIECESFTVISIDPLLVYEKKYYLQVYLCNCADKIAKKNNCLNLKNIVLIFSLLKAVFLTFLLSHI